MMNRKFAMVARTICAALSCAPGIVQAQSAGVWEVRRVPDQACNLLTGYGPEKGAGGRHGFRLLVAKSSIEDVVIVLTFTADEATAMALPPLDSEVPVHLTFFNPDLGNAGMNLSMMVNKDEDPGGSRALVGGLDALGIKYLRQYRTLDVYVGDSNARVRRISLINSGRSLDSFDSCINQLRER